MPSMRGMPTALVLVLLLVGVGQARPPEEQDMGPGSKEYFEGKGTTYILDQPGKGLCAFMNFPDEAVLDYAAINAAQWNEARNCGRCVEVTCVDRKCQRRPLPVKTVFVTDKCPKCKEGELKVSPSAFNLTAENAPGSLNISWRFVKCPVTGNIQYCMFKNSNEYWTAVQPTNVQVGLQDVLINGRPTKTLDTTFFYVNSGDSNVSCDLSQVKMELIDVGGNKITDTVALTPGECTEGSTNFGAKKDAGHSYTALIAGACVGAVVLVILGFVIKERIDRRRGREDPPRHPVMANSYDEIVTPTNRGAL